MALRPRTFGSDRNGGKKARYSSEPSSSMGFSGFGSGGPEVDMGDVFNPDFSAVGLGRNSGLSNGHKHLFYARNPSNSATHKVLTESKVFDTANPVALSHPISGYVINTTGGVGLIFAPRTVTGASTAAYDYNTRIGRKTYVTSIFLRGHILSGVFGSVPLGATANTTVHAFCARVMIIYDKQPTGSTTLPTLANVMEVANSLSFVDADSCDRFYLVWDKIWSMGGAYMDLTTRKLLDSSGRHSFAFKKYIQCNLKTVFYADSTSVAAVTATTHPYNADIKSGGIYLMTIGDCAANAGFDARADINCRLRFNDCT